MFKTLISKEILESLRTWRLVILLAVFLLNGLVSPMLAKYTPQLLGSIPDMPPGFAEMFSEASMQDAIVQYVKNIAQFGVLLVIILNMGLVAGEKERGTAAMLISKPVQRGMVLLSKWLTGLGIILLGLILAGLGGWIYTTVLFESPSILDFAVLNLLLAVFFTVYLSVTLLASTLARSQSMAAVGAFAGLAILLIWGGIPRFNDYAPGKLLDWGQSLFFADSASAWGALVVAAALTVITFSAAVMYFNREEI
jgi:ABC-2 type transport system permease protein